MSIGQNLVSPKGTVESGSSERMESKVLVYPCLDGLKIIYLFFYFMRSNTSRVGPCFTEENSTE